MVLNDNNLKFKQQGNGGYTLNNVEIKGFGKAYVDLYNDKLVFNSIETAYKLEKPIKQIDFLIYSKGNFLIEDRIHIGINGEQFEIATKKDEYQLKNFYDRLTRTRENAPITENSPENNNQQNQTANTIPETADKAAEEVKNKSSSATDEIRNFYNLMKEGIISEEEFEEKKKELLKQK